MVVLVLIGIITSFAVLQIKPRDPDEQLYEQARQLQAVLHQQWQEAILLSQQRALKITKKTITTQLWDSEQERWLTQASPRIQLNPGHTLQLNIEGRPVPLSDNTENVRLFFLASGELTEFELILSRAEAYQTRYSLKGQLTGDISLSTLP